MTLWQRAAALHDLPVVETFGALSAALAANAPTLLCAPPGAGKSTAAPLHLADAPWLAGRRVVVLEPRRVAARATARRMADVLGESVGATVGLQTRDERRVSAGTRVEVVTEGVLTRRLQNDPSLDGTGLVVFDEVHERNLPTDLGLAFALDARANLRADLRILLMSATPDVEALRRLLGDAEVVASEGRSHPVEIVWVPPRKGERPIEASAATVRRAVAEQTGDVLVFLPGIGEIRRVAAQLEGGLPPDVDVLALAGALPTAEQDAALSPSPHGRRRVVLSTDIAESSLTVPGVRVVVDAGLARVPRFDARTGMTRLVTISHSRASADQRAGRAGRVEPGVAYRLWTKLEQGTRRAHLPAEITQVDLAGLALELAAWGTPAGELRFADPPPRRALAEGEDLLRRLGALDTGGRLTGLGRRMLALPVHPRLARMIAEAGDDAPTACLVAALIDERDVLRGPPDTLPADISQRAAIVSGETNDDRADRRAVRQVAQRAADLARRAGVASDVATARPAQAGALLALAYPDRLAVARRQPGQFQLLGGTAAFTAPNDPLAGERFVVAADLDGRRDRSRIRLGAAIDAAEVARAYAGEVAERTTLEWDAERDDVVERRERRLGAVILDAVTVRPEPGPATTRALLDRVRATRLGLLEWGSEVDALRQRMAFVRGLLPAEPWPDWSDGTLLRTLDSWLAPYLDRATGAADVRALDPALLLLGQLSWDDRQRLAALAPPAIDTPAGRPAAVDYAPDRPTVAVRVQDMFGCVTHPTVGGGRVPVVLVLLSPADRPLQVTADLPGFWAGSWSAVRKDLAGRYPKHFWPADPSSAPPRRLGREGPGAQ